MRLHAQGEVSSNTVELHGSGTLRLTTEDWLRFPKADFDVGEGLELREFRELNCTPATSYLQELPEVLFKGTVEAEAPGTIFVATAGWLEWRLRTGINIGESATPSAKKLYSRLIDAAVKGREHIEWVIQGWENDHGASFIDLYYGDRDGETKRGLLKDSLTTLLGTTKPKEVLLFATPIFPPLSLEHGLKVRKLISGTFQVTRRMTAIDKKPVFGRYTFTFEKRPYVVPKNYRGVFSRPLVSFEAQGFSATSSGLVRGERVEDDGRVMTFDYERNWELKDSTVKMIGTSQANQNGGKVTRLRTNQFGEMEIPQLIRPEHRRFY